MILLMIIYLYICIYFVVCAIFRDACKTALAFIENDNLRQTALDKFGNWKWNYILPLSWFFDVNNPQDRLVITNRLDKRLMPRNFLLHPIYFVVEWLIFLIIFLYTLISPPAETE